MNAHEVFLIPTGSNHLTWVVI